MDVNIHSEVLSMKFIAFFAAAVISLTACLPAAAENELPPPQVSAKGCVVIDALSGDVLYARNEDMRLPMASTTKIMSAYIALMQEGLDEPFTVDSDAIKVEGSSMGLREGDTVTLRALVYGMLLPSGNDAANAAAVRISGSVDGFVRLMNSYAAEFGLEDTNFVTPSGLDDYTDEHYSTALDMARLTRFALRDPAFAEICAQTSASVEFGAPPYKRTLHNTNRLLSMCKGVVGVKTGFTDKARRCLVSACERDGAKLICVTLNDPNDWKDHEALYDWCFGKLKKVGLSPELSGYEIPCADKGVTVKAEGDRKDMLLPQSAAERMERVTVISPFLYLPVKAGDTVGETRFYLDGELICVLPVKAVTGADAGSYEVSYDLYI